jgi:hypothetical protein
MCRVIKIDFYRQRRIERTEINKGGNLLSIKTDPFGKLAVITQSVRSTAYFKLGHGELQHLVS